jgi:hypothetical protein
MSTIMPCFDRFPKEGDLIGRLLAGYGELELEMCACVIGRAFKPDGEPFAARDMAALSVRVELACSHVLDHALTQRTDGGSVDHGALHPE